MSPFWNDGDSAGLRMFDRITLVECKRWTAPTGYPELALFNDKLTSRGRPMGIFVAAAGIAGRRPDSQQRTRSSPGPWREVARSLS
jgi:hypothetical protein